MELKNAILGWYFDKDDMDANLYRIAADVRLLLTDKPADFDNVDVNDVINYAADIYATTDDGMWAEIERIWNETKVPTL